VPLNCGFLPKNGDKITIPIVIRLRKLQQHHYSVVYYDRLEAWVLPKNFKRAAAVRELAYIAEKIPPKLEQKSWTFRVRIEMPPMRARYPIIETFCPCPDCQHWVNSIVEPTLRISEDSWCNRHFSGVSNIKHHGALMVYVREYARFGVILEITDRRYFHTREDTDFGRRS
jgi:hypothetical protein